MPKKKNKKDPSAKAVRGANRFSKLKARIKSFYNKHPIISFILVIVLVWGVVWSGQVGIERYNFYRVEKIMDKTAKKIGSNFSIYDKKKVRSCGKRDEAFGEHLGGCSISYTYSLAPSDSPIGAAKKIDSLIQNSPGIKINSLFLSDYKLRASSPDVYSSFYYISSAKNIACEVRYYIPGKNKLNNSGLSVYFSCYLTSGDAKFPYFPVKN